MDTLEITTVEWMVVRGYSESATRYSEMTTDELVAGLAFIDRMIAFGQDIGAPLDGVALYIADQPRITAELHRRDAAR